MIHPIGGLQHWRPLTNTRPGDLNAIRRCGKANALMGRRFGQFCLVRRRAGQPLPDPD